MRQQKSARALNEHQNYCGGDGEEGKAVIEHHTDVLIVFFAIAASHEDLCPRAKPQNEHKHHNEENAP